MLSHLTEAKLVFCCQKQHLTILCNNVKYRVIYKTAFSSVSLRKKKKKEAHLPTNLVLSHSFLKIISGMIDFSFHSSAKQSCWTVNVFERQKQFFIFFIAFLSCSWKISFSPYSSLFATSDLILFWSNLESALDNWRHILSSYIYNFTSKPNL